MGTFWTFIKQIEGPGLAVALFVIWMLFRQLDRLTNVVEKKTEAQAESNTLINLLVQKGMGRGAGGENT